MKSEAGILVGYNGVSKGYRIYNPKTKKPLVSRNVKFDEFTKWNWEENEVEGTGFSKASNSNSQMQDEDEGENLADINDVLVRGTRTVEDIYTRCNVAS